MKNLFKGMSKRLLIVSALCICITVVSLVMAITGFQHTIPWDRTSAQFQIYDMTDTPVPNGMTSPTVTQFPYNAEQYKIKNTGNVPITIGLTETWMGIGSATWSVTGAVGLTFPIVLDPDVTAVATLSLVGTSLTGSYDFSFNII